MTDADKEERLNAEGKEPQQQNSSSAFSVYSHREKYVLVLISGCVSIWSSFATPIYYPALEIIESELHVSEELVNISVVVYLVFQGIAPTLLGGLADVYGRRPMLIACLLIFIAASIVIANTKNYAILLVFRVVQASGIGPTVVISAGIVGDITERHERGLFMGMQSGLTLLGQTFGSLIGAALIVGFNWHAIFWFLAIGSGTVLIVILLIFPETKRALVGNGSVVPTLWVNKAPMLAIPKVQRKWHFHSPDMDTLEPVKKPDYLTPFKILLYPEIAIILLNGAIHYSLWTMMLTTLTHELSTTYGYDTMKIGLCYLPGGFGGLLGAVVAGRVLDWIYRKRHARFTKRMESGALPPDAKFNIITSRMLAVFPYSFFTDGFTIMFGWCIYKKQSIATVLVSEFFICTGCVAMIAINITLLVDLFPTQSSAATSSVNLTRCLLAAALVAALDSMNRSMTIGGTFTLMAALGLSSTALLLVPMRHGVKWMEKRNGKTTI